MILTHWSEQPLKYIAPRYSGALCRNFYCQKPHGLWLSDESANVSWKSWCEDEEFRLNTFAYRTDFEVDLTKVLLLQCELDILNFTDEWADVEQTRYKNYEFTDYIIPWDRVGQRYYGILITPYIWECRLTLKTAWYNPWDCASGCFWNPKCLTKVSEKELN